MATLNLLQGSFNGTVGQVYGSKWKDKNLIKSRPFGVAPHTESQTKAVRAFECVNRVAAVFAKFFWQYLPLSDRKMLKHNAAAQWLKPLLQAKTFNPLNFQLVESPCFHISLDPPAQAKPDGTVFFKISLAPGYVIPPGTKLCAVAVDEAGYCGMPVVADCSTATHRLDPPHPQQRGIFVLVFLASPDGKKFFVSDSLARKVGETKAVHYSLDEQSTGDTWIDGRPIYLKVAEEQYIPNAYGQTVIRLGIYDACQYIGMDGVTTLRDTPGASMCVPWMGRDFKENLYVGASLLVLTKINTADWPTRDLYISMYYTKES